MWKLISLPSLLVHLILLTIIHQQYSAIIIIAGFASITVILVYCYIIARARHDIEKLFFYHVLLTLDNSFIVIEYIILVKKLIIIIINLNIII